jgi:hypothetical protein
MLFASIVVNTTADNTIAGDGLTTLREAITAANADPAPDTITFSLNNNPAFIDLSGPLPDLSSSMTIQGPGADQLAVEASTGGAYRVFNVVAGEVGLSGMSIAYGYLSNQSEGGAGIRVGNSATVTVGSCEIKYNTTESGDGGGILVDAGGAATVNNSCISDNDAGGSGAGLSSRGLLNLNNCTVAQNESSGNGGGGAFDGAGNITNSTIAFNYEAGAGGS